jgi:LmbE family N-acetylglucosaminyl deacetylase
MKRQAILVFCAHNDDQIVGAGGTLAKYAEEGKEVYTAIFSYGEQSHPHLKENVTNALRLRESMKSDRILGGKGIYYFGLTEGRFEKEIAAKKVKEAIARLIGKKKPAKIFTHCIDDPHPDHKAVSRIMLSVLEETGFKGDAYSFDVWNPVRVRERNKPKLVVDIGKTFRKKVRAFRAHKSQKIAMISLMWGIYTRAIINGMNHHCRYAEVFYKIT